IIDAVVDAGGAVVLADGALGQGDFRHGCSAEAKARLCARGRHPVPSQVGTND
ncbi:unnamed protein product, partial [Ectocarpus sp. 12 AP-2014]